MRCAARCVECAHRFGRRSFAARLRTYFLKPLLRGPTCAWSWVSARTMRPRSVFESGNIMAAGRVRPRRDDSFSMHRTHRPGGVGNDLGGVQERRCVCSFHPGSRIVGSGNQKWLPLATKNGCHCPTICAGTVRRDFGFRHERHSTRVDSTLVTRGKKYERPIPCVTVRSCSVISVWS